MHQLCTFLHVSQDARRVGEGYLGFLFVSFLMQLKVISLIHLPDVCGSIIS